MYLKAEAVILVYCFALFNASYSPTIFSRWILEELNKIKFPISLPKGIVHGDLDKPNISFSKGEINSNHRF